MFDLDQAIADWRRQMLAAGIQTPVPLEELEGHLREMIEERMASGLSTDEAFAAAVQAVGQAHAVQREFQKVAVANETRRWREGQISSGVLLGLLQVIVLGAVLFNSEMTFRQRMSGLAAMATSILFVAVARMSHRVFPVIRARRTRLALGFVVACVPVLVWFGVFSRFILPGNDFPFGQWLATIMWTSCPPLGISLGLIWGLEIAAQPQSGKGAKWMK